MKKLLLCAALLISAQAFGASSAQSFGGSLRVGRYAFDPLNDTRNKIAKYLELKEVIDSPDFMTKNIQTTEWVRAEFSKLHSKLKEDADFSRWERSERPREFTEHRPWKQEQLAMLEAAGF
jgi:hypothetical protein